MLAIFGFNDSFEAAVVFAIIVGIGVAVIRYVRRHSHRLDSVHDLQTRCGELPKDATDEQWMKVLEDWERDNK